MTFDPYSTLASLDARIETKKRIEADYASITVASEKTVDVLLEQSRAAYDLVQARLTALDGKAGTLIGVVTTGFGAIALIGDPSKIPTHGVWLVLALLALGVAFVAALCSLAPRGAQNPDVSAYLLAVTASDANNASRIKFDLAEAWVRDAAVLEHATIVKGRRLLTGTLALFFGVATLAVNYLSASPGEKPVPTFRVIVEPTGSPK
ncbi:MAG: hypothetical protein NVS2B3_18130 [Vulcanimicrobiaceae bacterium]